MAAAAHLRLVATHRRRLPQLHRYQVLDFSLRFFCSDLLYFFLLRYIYHFWQPTLLLFNLNIFYQKKYKIHKTNILSKSSWFNDLIYYFLN